MIADALLSQHSSKTGVSMSHPVIDIVFAFQKRTLNIYFPLKSEKSIHLTLRSRRWSNISDTLSTFARAK